MNDRISAEDRAYLAELEADTPERRKEISERFRAMKAGTVRAKEPPGFRRVWPWEGAALQAGDRLWSLLHGDWGRPIGADFLGAGRRIDADNPGFPVIRPGSALEVLPLYLAKRADGIGAGAAPASAAAVATEATEATVGPSGGAAGGSGAGAVVSDNRGGAGAAGPVQLGLFG